MTNKDNKDDLEWLAQVYPGLEADSQSGSGWNNRQLCEAVVVSFLIKKYRPEGIRDEMDRFRTENP